MSAAPGSPRAAAYLLAAVLAAAQAEAAGLVCHIHLAADHPQADGKPTIIPEVGDQQACAAMNRHRFGGEGRCHCSFTLGRQRVAPPGRPLPPGEGVDRPGMLP